MLDAGDVGEGGGQAWILQLRKRFVGLGPAVRHPHHSGMLLLDTPQIPALLEAFSTIEVMASVWSGMVQPVAWQRCHSMSHAALCLTYASSPDSVIDAIAVRLDGERAALTLYERRPPDVWPDGTVGAVPAALAVSSVGCSLPRSVAPRLVRDGAPPGSAAATDIPDQVLDRKAAEAAVADFCPPPASTCRIVSPQGCRHRES